MKMKLNKKGFTLIELLAAMVILAAIMVIAVPNVMGILNNSKADAYVEDAKKLLSLAEYKFRSDQTLRPAPGQCVILTLGYLDNSEFSNSPNGGAYEKDNSYVVIRNEGSTGNNKFVYYVTLDEKIDGGAHRGISYATYENLYEKENTDLVKNGSGTSPLKSYSSIGCGTVKKSTDA